MISILSASNRKENLTRVFSETCRDFLELENVPSQFFSLEDLPNQANFVELYDHQSSSFTKIGNEYIQSADKFLFVMPEYNGSYPGILKAFIDAIPPAYFNGKKAALIGISSGHAGNIRGMDHFADVLNYLNVTVLPKKLSIPRIDDMINNHNLIDEKVRGALEKQIRLLIDF